MQYDDFAVAIENRPDGGLVARLVACPYGSAGGEEPFVPPAATLPARVAGAERHVAVIGGAEDEPLPSSLEDVARELGAALFTGTIGARLRENLAALPERRGLRLRLVFDLADERLLPIVDLPWELLPDPREPGVFLGRDRRTPIVHFLEAHDRQRRLEPVRPLRVLLAAASPADRPRLDLERELEQVSIALERIPGVEVLRLEQADLASIRLSLREREIHVLHFMGHGEDGPEENERTLTLLGEDGRAEPVEAGMFAEHLITERRSLRLVVLNACSTAARGGVAAAVLRRTGAAAVVGMRRPIRDVAAIRFASALYRELARAEPLEAAVTEARLALTRLRPNSIEWAEPALFLRVPAGESLRLVAPARPAGEGDAASPPNGAAVGADPLHLGIVSFAGDRAEEIERAADEVLDLTPWFDGRRPRRADGWRREVLPRLERFLRIGRHARRPLVLHLAAHAGLALAAGHFLDVKSGLDVAIRQWGLGGSPVWAARAGDAAVARPPWHPAEELEMGAGDDAAFAVSLTHPVLDDVRHYLTAGAGGDPPAVGRLVHLALRGGTGPTAIADGSHALRLAHGLALEIGRRSPAERGGTLHLFAAAPNAFLFFLGQLSRGFGRVVFYEHDHEAGAAGAYRPGVELPVGRR